MKTAPKRLALAGLVIALGAAMLPTSAMANDSHHDRAYQHGYRDGYQGTDSTPHHGSAPRRHRVDRDYHRGVHEAQRQYRHDPHHNPHHERIVVVERHVPSHGSRH